MGGGQGGTTVYDFEPVQALSPPLSQSPAMISLHSPQSPISPTSPKSPTFSQSMFTRITGREYRASPIQISAPIVVPVRGRPRFPSVADISANGSLSLSSRSIHKKINRRSLSADDFWTNAHNQDLSSNKVSDSNWMQQSSKNIEADPQTAQQLQPHGVYEIDLEFYKNSIEFLKAHHGCSNIADDRTNRNKRKSSIPGRQGESSLLSEVLEIKNEGHEGASDSNDATVSKEQDDTNPFGPGSCWKDIDSSNTADYDLDEEYRSLLSSVDIMRVPCISSPTRYYDCPKSRKVVRTYMTSGEREFDELIEFGFPASAVIDDKEGKVKDCRFMTLRLTLTPWHARADESKLYGAGDARSAPLKEMVNKFFSKTTARMSSSPPRILSLVPEVKPSSLKGSKSPVPDHFPTQAKAQVNTLSSQVHPFDEYLVEFPTQIETLEALSIRRENTPPTSVSPPLSLAKNKAGAIRRERGFRILDPTSTPPLAPHIIRNARSAEVLNRGAEFYTSPPSTPSPTSLSLNQYQICPYGYQQQLPRKGSLSAMSMPMNTYYATNSTTLEENILVPPVVPPRRKFSSPAILYNEPQGYSLPLSPHDSNSQPRSTKPLASSSKAYSQQATLLPRRAMTSLPLPSSRTTPSSAPYASTSSPIPISSASRSQQQRRRGNQQYAAAFMDADAHSIAPFARTTRSPSRKGSDQFDSISARSMLIPTPPQQGYDVNTIMTTTTTVQEYPQHSLKDSYKICIPRTQYMPSVSSH
ncbi:hypothetical protein BGX27_001652 [Mortierella sp. AM989]|nr:hypothetical protein BGX27_001652 [Mortierella sp. AM989]